MLSAKIIFFVALGFSGSPAGDDSCAAFVPLSGEPSLNLDSNEDAIVKALFEKKWKVKEEELDTLPKGDKRSPYRYRRVLVEEFDHLGMKGDLHLDFFNHKLISFAFYPQKSGEFFIRVKERAASSSGKILNISCGDFQITEEKDFFDKPYLNIRHRSGYEELEAWLQTYS